MIVDKKILQPLVDDTAQTTTTDTENTEEEKYTVNCLCDVYKALKSILSTLLVDDTNPGSEKLFKTIKMDNGQLARIKGKKLNEEYGIGFPAAFIHFINVRYLVSQSRIGEGRATVRIHYVLNDLNNSDDEIELKGYKIFQQINDAIQSQKGSYPALTQRFQLQYFDQPDSMDDGLQPFWIDYEVWFTEYSASRYRHYVTRYLVVPPFTNHSDQKPENNVDKHEDHKEPTYDEVSGFVDKIDS